MAESRKVDDTALERGWLGAATPAYSRWMKILAVVAALSTSIIEIHSRKLLNEVRLSEPVAGFVSYLSVASISLLVTGAVLRGMFWANERRYKTRDVNRRG